MGSVSDLYTTGDNDPEIEPVQYYRHYMYCDACGSFDIEPWAESELNVEYRGVRCKSCQATYANGTKFFTNLKANPRRLTIADVPRPLGSSYFLRG